MITFKNSLHCFREWTGSCRAIGSYLDIQPYKNETSTSQKSVPALEANLAAMWSLNQRPKQRSSKALPSSQISACDSKE